MSAGSVVRAGAAYEAILEDNVTAQADAVVASLKRVEKAFEQLKDPAREVASAFKVTSTAMKQMTQSSNRATTAAQAIGRAMQRLARGVNVAGQAIGQAMIHIGNEMRMIGLAATAAGGAITGFFANAIRVTGEYNQLLGTLEVAFGSNSDAALKWAKEFSQTAKRSLNETIQGISTFRNVLTGLEGAVPNDLLDEMAKNFQARTVDMAAAFGMADAEVMTKFLAGLTGSAPEEIRRLGVNIDDKTMKEFAETIGVVFNELGQAEKMLLRYLAAMQQSSKHHGRAAAEAEMLEGQMKELKAAWEDFNRETGQEFLEQGVAIVRMLQEMVRAMNRLDVSSLKALAGLGVTLGITGTALMVIGTALTLLGPIVLGIATFIATLAGLGGAIAFFSGTAGWLLLIGVALANIGVILGGAVFGFFFLREFPVMAAFARLKRAFAEITELAETSVGALEDAIALGDWDSVWSIVTLSGKIAFLKLAKEITIILSEAMMRAAVGFITAIQQWFRNPSLDISSFFPDGSIFDTEKLEVELMARAIKLDLERQRKELEKISQSGIKFVPSRSPADYETQKKAMEDGIGNAFKSVGSFSAMFAGASGRFGPVFSASDRKQDTMIKNQEASLKIQKEIRDLTAKQKGLVMR